jgi:hypothetical protein
MTSIEVIAIKAIEEALVDSEPTWVTLPPVDIEISDAFRRALDEFDAGPKAAAVAATEWLQQSAVTQYRLSRTMLYIANGAIAGYYSLCSSSVELSQRSRTRHLELRTPLGTLPASLVTWLAKDHRADIDGAVLMKHAFATARRATLTQAAIALALDPFDSETAELWKARYGFRESSGKSGRLWTPLFAID